MSNSIVNPSPTSQCSTIEVSCTSPTDNSVSSGLSASKLKEETIPSIEDSFWDELPPIDLYALPPVDNNATWLFGVLPRVIQKPLHKKPDEDLSKPASEARQENKATIDYKKTAIESSSMPQPLIMPKSTAMSKAPAMDETSGSAKTKKKGMVCPVKDSRTDIPAIQPAKTSNQKRPSCPEQAPKPAKRRKKTGDAASSQACQFKVPKIKNPSHKEKPAREQAAAQNAGDLRVMEINSSSIPSETQLLNNPHTTMAAIPSAPQSAQLAPSNPEQGPALGLKAPVKQKPTVKTKPTPKQKFTPREQPMAEQKLASQQTPVLQLAPQRQLVPGQTPAIQEALQRAYQTALKQDADSNQRPPHVQQKLAPRRKPAPRKKHTVGQTPSSTQTLAPQPPLQQSTPCPKVPIEQPLYQTFVSKQSPAFQQTLQQQIPSEQRSVFQQTLHSRLVSERAPAIQQPMSAFEQQRRALEQRHALEQKIALAQRHALEQRIALAQQAVPDKMAIIPSKDPSSAIPVALVGTNSYNNTPLIGDSGLQSRIFHDRPKKHPLTLSEQDKNETTTDCKGNNTHIFSRPTTITDPSNNATLEAGSSYSPQNNLSKVSQESQSKKATSKRKPTPVTAPTAATAATAATNTAKTNSSNKKGQKRAREYNTNDTHNGGLEPPQVSKKKKNNPKDKHSVNKSNQKPLVNLQPHSLSEIYQRGSYVNNIHSSGPPHPLSIPGPLKDPAPILQKNLSPHHGVPHHTMPIESNINDKYGRLTALNNPFPVATLQNGSVLGATVAAYQGYCQANTQGASPHLLSPSNPITPIRYSPSSSYQAQYTSITPSLEGQSQRALSSMKLQPTSTGVFNHSYPNQVLQMSPRVNPQNVAQSATSLSPPHTINTNQALPETWSQISMGNSNPELSRQSLPMQPQQLGHQLWPSFTLTPPTPPRNDPKHNIVCQDITYPTPMVQWQADNYENPPSVAQPQPQIHPQLNQGHMDTMPSPSMPNSANDQWPVSPVMCTQNLGQEFRKPSIQCHHL